MLRVPWQGADDVGGSAYGQCSAQPNDRATVSLVSDADRDYQKYGDRGTAQSIVQASDQIWAVHDPREDYMITGMLPIH